MASWKLKGVVPDSDDEDSPDSQSNASDGDGNDTAHQGHESPRNALFGHNSIVGKGNKMPIGQQFVERPVVKDNGSADNKQWEDDNWEAAQSLKANTNDRLMLASSSPDLPQVFKAPLSLWDIGHALTDSESGSNGNLPDLPVANSLPAVDEISKTYVRLKSPVSSLLSPLEDSQQSEMPNPLSNTSLDAEGYSPRFPILVSNNDGLDHTSTHTMQGPANLYRRALRERAPIQLHPYAMEQEKYRQTLKARGIAPMRIAQTQEEDHRRHHIPSSDPISQDFESQDGEQETEESQPMDYNWDLDPVSMEKNIETQVPRNQRSDSSASNDGDEFPDINELFQGRRLVTRGMEPQRRINTYSSKARRPKVSQIHTERTWPTDPLPKVTDVFHVPASPPATSSPFASMVRSVRRTVFQASAASSEEPTPSWLDQDDLPTPATSAMKPVSDHMILESVLDDDPFANESLESASSSSDEGVQIREVSKKLRGVLPASHLRLDQQLKQHKHSMSTQRGSVTASPEKSLIIRGVALPKAPGATEFAPSSMSNGLPFLSDEIAEDESDYNGSIMEDDNAGDLNSAFSQSRVGYAEEEDRIDAMLPSLKRQMKFNLSSNKKIRVGSASLTRGSSRQPKITQHLVNGTSSKNQSRHRARNSKQFQGVSIRDRKSKPPRLSIIDVASLTSGSDGKMPQFIKVAARTARSKPGQGRHSPSKKFIRLANREDTFDAQSMLEEWKSGRIIPKIVETSVANSGIASRPPLTRITGNHQTRFQPPMVKAKPRQALKSGYGRLDKPRQLVVSRGRQMSIKKFAFAKQPPLPQPHSIPNHAPRAALHVTQRRSTKPRSGVPQSRPAQLETSEITYSSRNPGAAFTNTKKALDSLFKLNRKRPVKQQNVQLHRFLADDDIVLPSVEASSSPRSSVPSTERLSTAPTTTFLKPRKRLPQRVDIGAARYRQPSEPLVLDVLPLVYIQNVTGQENKLMGLGKFGTRYPIHFDIMPLRPGIFFHESTFIGSGCLSEVIKVPAALTFGASRAYFSLRLGDKDFRWGQWNEDVSSEVGLFFDCLVEVLIQYPPSPNSSDPTPAASVELMINYLQYHICFGSSEARSGFLSRMLEILHDFSCRVSEAGYQTEEKKTQRWIDTMVRCTVLILQLLHLSREMAVVTTIKLEDLLKRFACVCAKLLIHQGLDGLRKLYDDLQYLSFRECGIQNDQYIALSWVTIMKVLGAARIPGGSFWEIANMALAEGDKKVIDDARLMEEKWYSVYSLLPLCEFNDSGVVISGLRHRISFDNWVMPQGMLKTVFILYSTNSKQSPGFNDYCRALFSRCHYLAREWGWWRCTGTIGTMFDFFASHKLGHLRNEEVYKSPRFLEELDTEPSLDVDPEDRCFHIFLKIVALAIKHLHETGDERSIRNLVARLLPNHDRQYPKEEAIHQRDLAALRNHHDLLCTLYWASPQDCRPSLSLIQELVIADHSHKEACLINLRALDNLARYVFTSPADDSAVYQQVTRWELTFFDKLLHQYLDTSSDFQKQAELLADSHKHPITEAEMQDAMNAYRNATRAVIDTLLSNLGGRIRKAKNAEANLSCLNAELLTKILNPGIYQGIQSAEQRMFSNALDALQSYMIRADQLHPFTNPQPMPIPAGPDSQGSFDVANVDFERQMMIYPIHETIVPNFATITKDVLECRLHQFEEPHFVESLVRCWTHMISLVTEEKCDLRDFLVEGPYAVFENRRRYPRAQKYWPLFLWQLLESKNIEDLKVTGFDLTAEWMQILTSNSTSRKYEEILSRRLYRNDHYLFKAGDLLLDDSKPAGKEWPSRHLQRFKVALKSMSKIKANPKYGGFAEDNHISEKQIQSLFSAALKSTMDSMQHQLQLMSPGSTAHISYVECCQDAVSSLRAYTSTIHPVTDFFLRASLSYWPKSLDPRLYAAGLMSYSFRLEDFSEKPSFELFHYLYSGWKSDQMLSRVSHHTKCVLQVLKKWAFTEYMLVNFVPAIILAGFESAGGCLLAKTFLPILAQRTPHFLQRSSPEGVSTFAHLINILKMIINGIRVRACTERQPRDFRHGVWKGHRGIVSITYHFWIAIQPALDQYVELHPNETSVLDEITSSLDDYMSDVRFWLTVRKDYGAWTRVQFKVTTGEYVARFVAALQADFEHNWTVVSEEEIMLNGNVGPIGEVCIISLVEGVPTLEDLAELWKTSSGHINRQSLESWPRNESFPDWMVDYQVESFPGALQGIF